MEQKAVDLSRHQSLNGVARQFGVGVIIEKAIYAIEQVCQHRCFSSFPSQTKTNSVLWCCCPCTVWAETAKDRRQQNLWIPTHLTPLQARPGPPAELISNASWTLSTRLVDQASAPQPTHMFTCRPTCPPSLVFLTTSLVRAAVCEGGRRWPSAVCCWCHRLAPSCVQTVCSCVQTRRRGTQSPRTVVHPYALLEYQRDMRRCNWVLLLY